MASTYPGMLAPDKPKSVIPQSNPIPTNPMTPQTSGAVPKSNLPTAPTADQTTHQAWINNPASGQGGMDSYVNTQNQRWQAANQANDTNLMNRLQSDSQRVGYTLNPYSATNQADPNQQRFTQYQQQQQELMNQLKSYMQPKNYDPNSDPQAMAYKQYYDNLAKDGSRNAMEAMNERGLLNSSMTAGEVAKAQQDANLAFGTKVADLGSQFYQRQQDQFNNGTRLLGLVGDLQQREQDNAYRDKTYDRGVYESNRTYDRQVAKDDAESARYADETAYKRIQDEIKNGQWDKSFDLEMQKWADDKGLKWANFDLDTKKTLANIALEQQRNAISQQNANTSAFSASNSAANAKERLQLDKSKLGEGNLGQLTNSLNQTFGSFNEDGKFQGVDSNKSSQLRQAIINMNLPDYQTDQLLASYGLPTN